MVNKYKHIINSKLISYFTDEVIKRRLLIDGDGTGDDRRLNILLKTFLKWCLTKNDSPENKYLCRNHIL